MKKIKNNLERNENLVYNLNIIKQWQTGDKMKFILNLKPQINKKQFFNKLHIVKGTETYKSADGVFEGLRQIIEQKMKLYSLYAVVDTFDLGIFELDTCKKYVLCFISFQNDMSGIIHEMMSSGSYLKGYLLNEMAADALFNASNEMNKIIREQAVKLKYKLTKRYAPGDGEMDIKLQEKILDALNKEVHVPAHLNEAYMIIPEKSLLYLYGLARDQDTCSSYYADTFNGDDSCSQCTNKNCEYRNINDEKI